MKNLLIFVVISAFSFMVFGEGEKSAELVEAPKAAEEAKPVEEAKPAAKEDVQPAEETKAAEEKQDVKEAKPVEEAKPVAKEDAQPAEEKVQETESVEANAVQTGVKYECDGGKSYTLHEPGVSDESHLCELDAGHTDAAADWYAFNQSSFCKEKLQELIELYNCAIK